MVKECMLPDPQVSVVRLPLTLGWSQFLFLSQMGSYGIEKAASNYETLCLSLAGVVNHYACLLER
jgi:hypothetical protein